MYNNSPQHKQITPRVNWACYCQERVLVLVVPTTKERKKMSVNWDCSKVRDYKELHEDEYEWALSSAFLTSWTGFGWFDVIGFGSITEANVGEVWARVSILQGMGVIGMRKGSERVQITRADIVRRIGFHSNYSTLTRTKWISEKLKPLMDITVDDVKNSLEKAEQPA
jgi:hypothetical protein